MNDVEIELERLERELQDAVVRQDAGTLERLIGDDFQLVGPGELNLSSKKQWIDAATGPFVMRSFAFEEFWVRSYGEWAIVYHRLAQEATFRGRDASLTFITSDVWVLRDDRWQLVLRHTCPLSASGAPKTS